MECFTVGTPTLEDYEQLMQWAEELGNEWSGGGLPTSYCCLDSYKEQTGIFFRTASKRISFAEVPFFKSSTMHGPVIDMDKFAEMYGFVNTLPEDYF